jgi:hypothetical protein
VVSDEKDASLTMLVETYEVTIDSSSAAKFFAGTPPASDLTFDIVLPYLQPKATPIPQPCPAHHLDYSNHYTVVWVCAQLPRLGTAHVVF